MVQVAIGDINDNGPYFTNFTANVTEEQNPEVSVIDLTQYTHDLDGPGNQGPYTYQHVSGNDRSYEFFRIDSTGQVKAIKVIDRETDASFNVPVLVKDNGQPTQSSTLTFKITVLDINDNPPRPRYANIFLSLYNGSVPTTAIANVRPLDDDIVGTYSCQLTVQNPTALFRLEDNSCNLGLIGFPSESSYTLQLKGNDGSESPVTYDIGVKVSVFDNVSLSYSTVIQIADVSADHFIQNKYSNFILSVKAAFTSQDTVQLIGLTQHSSGDLLLHLAVKSFVDNEYYSLESLRQKLTSSKTNIEKETGIFIVGVAYSACGVNHCNNGGSCASNVLVKDTSSVADSDFLVFSNPTLSLSTYCVCPPEYTGPDCSQEATPCGNIYCHNGGTCFNQQCQCPDTWTGSSCEQDVNECKQNPCQNGATCENTAGSFTCHCRDGYFGKTCQEGNNYCQSNPCIHGKCENLVDTFKCKCNYGYFGQTCQLSSYGFLESSYLEFPTLTSLSSIEVTFATEKTNSLLLYNPSSRNSNFVALEIIDGRVQFSVSLGSETARLALSLPVNTATWFRVKLARNTEVWESHNF